MLPPSATIVTPNPNFILKFGADDQPVHLWSDITPTGRLDYSSAATLRPRKTRNRSRLAKAVSNVLVVYNVHNIPPLSLIPRRRGTETHL